MTVNPDILKRRCPRLGSNFSFQYCRYCEEGRSARVKALDRWWEYFDVVGFFRTHSGEEPLRNMPEPTPNPSKEKVTSPLELVEVARKRLAWTLDRKTVGSSPNQRQG